MAQDTHNLQHCSDETLARHAQAGCDRSFEALVLRHEAGILRFLSARLATGCDAEDLAQETFVRVHRGLGSYDPARPFRAWLFTIARHVWIDRYRARRPVLPAEPGVSLDRRDPAALLARRDEVAGLWRLASELLTENQWTCLWMRHQAAMEIDEIAEAMGRSALLVRVTLHRARQRLAKGIPALARRDLRLGLVPPLTRVVAAATVTRSMAE